MVFFFDINIKQKFICTHTFFYFFLIMSFVIAHEIKSKSTDTNNEDKSTAQDITAPFVAPLTLTPTTTTTLESKKKETELCSQLLVDQMLPYGHTTCRCGGTTCLVSEAVVDVLHLSNPTRCFGRITGGTITTCPYNKNYQLDPLAVCVPSLFCICFVLHLFCFVFLLLYFFLLIVVVVVVFMFILFVGVVIYLFVIVLLLFFFCLRNRIVMLTNQFHNGMHHPLRRTWKGLAKANNHFQNSQIYLHKHKLSSLAHSPHY